MHYQGRQERDIALNPLELKPIQCATHGGSGALAIRPVGNQLSNHWVIVHADLTAFTDPGIYPHGCRLRWRAKTQQTPARGYEPPERVLCINPGFDGPAADPHIILGQCQRLTGGNTQHPLNQIDTGDQFGHRVLYLQARIHLQKIEVTRIVNNEFHSTGRAIVDGLRQGDGLGPHLRPGCRVNKRRWRLLKYLLMATLNGAFALV